MPPSRRGAPAGRAVDQHVAALAAAAGTSGCGARRERERRRGEACSERARCGGCGSHGYRLQVQVSLKSSATCFHGRMSELLTIGEVARRSGVASSALRFYEERGLIDLGARGLRPPPLPARRDPPRRVHRLRPAGRADARGDRRGARQAAADRVPTRARLGAALEHVDRAHRRAHRRARAPAGGLTECIGCGCLSLDRCRLANPGDRAAARGPGPRYWLGDRPSLSGARCRPSASKLSGAASARSRRRAPAIRRRGSSTTRCRGCGP